MPKKCTIDDMQQTAAAHGGWCLSTVYINSKTPLLWKCVAGHEWEQRAHDIRTGRWCKTCSLDSRRDSLDEIQAIAKSHNGKCLSTEYINKRTKLRWECSQGHIWEAYPTPIKRGGWCPLCARKSSKRSVSRKHRLTIDDMKQLAMQQGGECLSSTYHRMHIKLLWKCCLGHTWESAPQNIKKGAWCPICEPRGHNLRVSITELSQLAFENGGELLSNEYTNSSSPLRWRCSEGHEWDAPVDRVKYGGTWCPYCSGKHNWSISRLHEYAQSMGGKCLSDKYTRQTDPVEWECRDGHRWKRSPGSMIQQGQWCPTCHIYLGEEICRAYFETLFENEFPKSHPSWLISTKRRRLELDGYCNELQLAFEHHGQQHYRVGRFTPTGEQLISRKGTDELKRTKCRETGVLLIEIPELDTLLPLTELRTHIKARILEWGRQLPPGFDDREIDLSRIRSIGRLDELKGVAESKGGRCLSDAWLGAKRRHEFECKDGHHWQAAAYEVLVMGTWCPECYRRNQGAIAKARNIDEKWKRLTESVEARGGTCLTGRWLGANEYHEFQCAKGHIWRAWANSVRRGTWCPQCAKGKPRTSINN